MGLDGPGRFWHDPADFVESEGYSPAWLATDGRPGPRPIDSPFARWPIMKRAILRSCLGLLAVSAGCSAPAKQVSHSKPPEDPTAWSGSAVTRDDDSSGSGPGGGGK